MGSHALPTSALQHHHSQRLETTTAAFFTFPTRIFSASTSHRRKQRRRKGLPFCAPKGSFSAKVPFFMFHMMLIVSQSVALELPLSSCWAGQILLCFTGEIGHPAFMEQKVSKASTAQGWGTGVTGDSHRGAPHAFKFKRRKTLSVRPHIFLRGLKVASELFRELIVSVL